MSEHIIVLIKEFIKHRNFSDEDAAKYFDVSNATLKIWLSGKFNFDLYVICFIESKINMEIINVVK